MGGAFSRIPHHAAPFPSRAARFWLNIYGFWPDPADDRARTAFIRALASDMEPFATWAAGTSTSCRKTTAKDPGNPQIIQTVFGGGYRLGLARDD